MRHIKKLPEPSEFTHWKSLGNDEWQPSYSNLQNPEKTKVHESLLREQGHVCCYCERRIYLKESHIEHFKPKDARLVPSYAHLALDYKNFHASCPGYPEQESESLLPSVLKISGETCGPAKGNWYSPTDTVSPLDPDCSLHFQFTLSGRMLVSEVSPNPNASKETISKLNLDHQNLRSTRGKAINAVLEIISSFKKVEDKDRETKTILNLCQSVNSDGFHFPFATAISQVISP